MVLAGSTDQINEASVSSTNGQTYLPLRSALLVDSKSDSKIKAETKKMLYRSAVTMKLTPNVFKTPGMPPE